MRGLPHPEALSQFATHWPDEKFDGKDHPHPTCAAERKKLYSAISDRVKNYTGDSDHIGYIGETYERYNTKVKNTNGWAWMPTKEEDSRNAAEREAARRKHGLYPTAEGRFQDRSGDVNACSHRVEQCTCRPMVNSLVAVHVYTFGPCDIAEAVRRHSHDHMIPVYVAVHKFPKDHGSIYYSECEYKRDYGFLSWTKLFTDSNGYNSECMILQTGKSSAVYRHRSPDWLFQQPSTPLGYLQADIVANYPQSIIVSVSFGQRPLKVPKADTLYAPYGFVSVASYNGAGKGYVHPAAAAAAERTVLTSKKQDIETCRSAYRNALAKFKVNLRAAELNDGAQAVLRAVEDAVTPKKYGEIWPWLVGLGAATAAALVARKCLAKSSLATRVYHWVITWVSKVPLLGALVSRLMRTPEVPRLVYAHEFENPVAFDGRVALADWRFFGHSTPPQVYPNHGVRSGVTKLACSGEHFHMPMRPLAFSSGRVYMTRRVLPCVFDPRDPNNEHVALFYRAFYHKDQSQEPDVAHLSCAAKFIRQCLDEAIDDNERMCHQSLADWAAGRDAMRVNLARDGLTRNEGQLLAESGMLVKYEVVLAEKAKFVAPRFIASVEPGSNCYAAAAASAVSWLTRALHSYYSETVSGEVRCYLHGMTERECNLALQQALSDGCTYAITTDYSRYDAHNTEVVSRVVMDMLPERVLQRTMIIAGNETTIAMALENFFQFQRKWRLRAKAHQARVGGTMPSGSGWTICINTLINMVMQVASVLNNKVVGTTYCFATGDDGLMLFSSSESAAIVSLRLAEFSKRAGFEIELDVMPFTRATYLSRSIALVKRVGKPSAYEFVARVGRAISKTAWKRCNSQDAPFRQKLQSTPSLRCTFLGDALMTAYGVPATANPLGRNANDSVDMTPCEFPAYIVASEAARYGLTDCQLRAAAKALQETRDGLTVLEDDHPLAIVILKDADVEPYESVEVEHIPEEITPTCFEEGRRHVQSDTAGRDPVEWPETQAPLPIGEDGLPREIVVGRGLLAMNEEFKRRMWVSLRNDLWYIVDTVVITPLMEELWKHALSRVLALFGVRKERALVFVAFWFGYQEQRICYAGGRQVSILKGLLHVLLSRGSLRRSWCRHALWNAAALTFIVASQL